MALQQQLSAPLVELARARGHRTISSTESTQPLRAVRAQRLRNFARVARTMAASRSWVGICTRTDGCILHARHAGACKVGDVGEEDYEVESILDQRGSGRALKYLLKWKGWPAEDSTWEPKSALGSGGVAWEAESPGRENSFPSRKKADVRQHQTA